MEIRLVHMFSKRRIILYPGDMLDTSFPKPRRSAYIQATVVPRVDSDAEAVNILGRIQKYHGNTLRCASHMFPADDADELCDKYDHIFTMDIFGSRNHLVFVRNSMDDQITETKKGSDLSE